MQNFRSQLWLTANSNSRDMLHWIVFIALEDLLPEWHLAQHRIQVHLSSRSTIISALGKNSRGSWPLIKPDYRLCSDFSKKSIDNFQFYHIFLSCIYNLMTPFFQPSKHCVLNCAWLVEGIYGECFEGLSEFNVFFGSCKGKVDTNIIWYNWHVRGVNGFVGCLQLGQSRLLGWLISNV